MHCDISIITSSEESETESDAKYFIKSGEVGTYQYQISICLVV